MNYDDLIFVRVRNTTGNPYFFKFESMNPDYEIPFDEWTIWRTADERLEVARLKLDAEDHFFPRPKIVNEHNVDAFLTIKKKSSDEIQHGEWIPIKFRPMTEEEVTEYEDKWGWHIAEDERVMFDCPLPVDGQQILISTKYGVSVDYCTYDSEYGYGLEDRDDWDGVNAWMPLPTQYQKEGE